ncbi:MAG: hypothetical protein JWM40_2061 [Frankiales bacterium]|nr:hypothetical protein [Frankiales bacterium]
MTLGVLCAIVAIVCLLVVALGVLPFVLAVDAAERRGFSTTRWGAVALGGTALMLVVAYWDVVGDHARVWLLPAVLLSWAGLLVLSLLGERSRIGGPQGAHER